MKRVGLWAFVAVGIAVAVFGVVSWINPATSCRGAQMGPGDTCQTSDVRSEATGKVQTYDDRIRVARQQAPFVVAAGLGMSGFGLVLVQHERKRAHYASSDIGP